MRWIPLLAFLLRAISAPAAPPPAASQAAASPSPVSPSPTAATPTYYYVRRTPLPKVPAPDNTVDFLPRQGGPVSTEPAAAPSSSPVTGILPNGSFDSGLQKWDPADNRVVFWKSEAEGRRGVVQFVVPKVLAEDTGATFYSNPFPIESGRRYRVQADVKTFGPEVKVFIKAYGPLRGENRQRYQAVLTCVDPARKGPPDAEWHTWTRDFTPSPAAGEIRTARVMLYAYLRPGAVYFDKVGVFQDDTPTSPGAGAHASQP